MSKQKLKKLKDKGWKIGSAQDFLGLSDEEARYINSKLNLSNLLKETRNQKGMTQDDLASVLGTSQPRVAFIEQGAPSVKVDQILRALYALGVPETKISEAFKNLGSPEPT